MPQTMIAVSNSVGLCSDGRVASVAWLCAALLYYNNEILGCCAVVPLCPV